jgi:hypothetical protein
MTLSPEHIPGNPSWLVTQPTLKDTVSSLALSRASDNVDLAITMQVTAQEAMNLLGNRTHHTNLAKWWKDLTDQKMQEDAANDNTADIAVAA